MFSSIIIRECGLKGNEALSISLHAAPSFPACPRALDEEDHQPVADSWAPHDVSKRDSFIELSLISRISEGRIGVTYVARVMSAAVGGNDVSDSLPQELCLKFAKKQRCRSLARESWFYERLESCQGTSVARCFGLYTSTFSEQEDPPDNIIPWTHIQYPFNPFECSWSPIPSIDWLPDDLPKKNSDFRDIRGFKRDSPWNTWNPSDDDPTIAVLLLEKLGERCSEYWKIGWKPKNGLKEDLVQIVKDIGACGVVHTDVTAFNILRYVGPQTSQARCPCHNVVHGWRIIDFDRSWMVDMEHAGSYTKQSLKSPEDHIGKYAFFWGDQLDA